MANIFGKLKQIKDMRTQAKQLQGALGNEVSTADHDGVSISVNGQFELTDVKIDRDMGRDQLAKAIAKAGTEAIKKMQKTVAQKIQAMGGLSKLTGQQ
jgi:DNA-binding protein YbaB